MNTPFKWCLPLVVFVPCALVAQVAVTGTGERSTVSNDWPFDALVLTSSGAGAYTSVRVPAHGRVPVPAGSDLKSVEPIAIDIGRREMFRSCGTAQTSPAPVHVTVPNDFLTTATARERIELATAIARLELEQRQDERDTYRNDALRSELRTRAERYLSAEQRLADDQREQWQEIGSDITDLALAWSQVEHERLSILHDQFQTLAPIVDQARLAYRIRVDERQRYDRTVAGWQAYSAAVVQAMDAAARALPSKIALDSPLTASGLRKACDGPSGGWDWFELDGPDLPGVSALVGEASFDHAGRQLTPLRRLSKSTHWVGRVDWPAVSTQAEFRLRWPGSVRWSRAGNIIRTERPSIAESVARAERAVNQIEKNLKETNFRAGGGDSVRTRPIF
jgi:hypothetical protein